MTRKKETVRVPTAQRYTPAEVLAAWDRTPFGGDFTYRGKVVLGLQKLGSGIVYRAQLAGDDLSTLIGADETLRRLVKP